MPSRAPRVRGFFPPGLNAAEVRYVALTPNWISDVPDRIGVNSQSIEFDILVATARKLECDSSEEIARRAVGHALRAILSSTQPPQATSTVIHVGGAAN